MWRVTIKELLDNKLRLTLTAIAIVLGVTFISGTYVLTDTLHNTISSIFSTVYQNIDYQVRGVAQFSNNAGGAVRNPVPASVLTTVRHVPGVKAAAGSVTGYAQFVARDGKPIPSNAGTLGLSFIPNPRISTLHIVQGKPPKTAQQVVMDAGTAKKYGFKVGDSVHVLFSRGSGTYTISGISQYGNANSLAGATFAAFTTSTAQSMFDEAGHFDHIDIVAAPGANESGLQRAIARALPSGVEVVTGKTVIAEQTSSVNQALSFFSTALLVFAFISIFVGAFTILNTFSITVGQRTRELGLLRIVGASSRQIFGSVLGEAAIVGLVSSIIGIGLGVLAALGLRVLLRQFGISLPSGSLVFEPRTVVVSLVVGVGATVVAAINPARRAVGIPPIAALGGSLETGQHASRNRNLGGGAVTILGGVLLELGLTKPSLPLVGAGAAAIFIGVTILAPAIARPLSSVVGRPFAWLMGVSGELGRENSMRSPRRTAQAASALMIGLALVSAIAVFGASLSASSTSSVKDAINANLIVRTSNGSGSGTLSPDVPRAVSSAAGVTASTTVYEGQFEFRQSLTSLKASSSKDLSKTVNLIMTAGSISSLANGDLLIDSTTATSDHLKVGDTVPVKFAFTGPSTMRIGGIYQANALIGSYFVGDAFYRSHYRNPLPAAVLLATDGSSSAEQTVKQALAPYPAVEVQTRSEFEKAQLVQVNQLLGLVYALLGLAVIIALIGIVNTLMLSVFERTREIGLLRAVGTTRKQIRAMIRTESVILSLFGAIVGIAVGAGLGIALAASLSSQGITETSVPVANLVIFLVLAAVLGLLAASWPARRAANMDVLAAISAE